MRIDPRPLNLSSIIHTAVDSIMPAAKAKAIRLQVIIDPSAGFVVGDPDRLQQVIWNLLSNAVKFTPAGGRVQIQLEQSESLVEVTVSDSGVGVAPEFLPRIFERFSQEDSSSTRTYGGLGMGLSIVKYIAELHGGTVSAFSEGTGKGTAFTVALPMAQESATMHQAQPSGTGKQRESMPSAPTELVGLKLLVVDDEIDTCEMIQAAFEQCGSTVQIATSASDALIRMAEWRPDMLISDINMPHVDGYQLIQQIRERESQSGARVPAIALTALARIEDRVKALGAGYQMHVPKPVELSELYAVVTSLASVIIKDSTTT
jgi:CheY-like chemotaxis protein/anti-sigma regulatory factor (Ser/Thr protein kinase)